MSPLRTISQFAVACGSCEHKPCWLSKLDVSRGHLTSACLKNLGTRCEVPTVCFSVGFVGSLLIVGCHAWGGVYGEMVSQPLLPILIWVSSCLLNV